MTTASGGSSKWERNRAATVFAFLGVLIFGAFGIWSLLDPPEVEGGGTLPVLVSIAFIAIAVIVAPLVGRDLITQVRRSSKHYPTIERDELPYELAMALTILESRSGPGHRNRRVTPTNLIRIDGRTFAWHWTGLQRKSTTSVVAVSSRRPFPAVVSTSVYIPGPLQHLNPALYNLLGADIEHTQIDDLGRVVAVATANGSPDALDSDSRIWPIVLAGITSRGLESLSPDLQARVPSGHEVVPVAMEMLIGFAQGTTVLLMTRSTSIKDRRKLIATAERIHPYL